MGEYHAFSERIGRETALRPLTEENLRELVGDYLESERIGGAVDGAIEPFTKDGLTVILQRSQGNIRQVLSVCSQMLDSGIDDDRSELDQAYIQEQL